MNKLIGNEHIKKTLTEKSNVRSFIIEGPEGSGRHTLLDILVMSKICTGDHRPCGKCAACKRYESKNSIDIVYPDVELPVKEFREIINTAIEYPREEKCKFYIIDNADDMKVHNQNALLKNLEEPFDFTYFIIICNTKESLLKTIVSRCTVLTLKPLEEHVIKDSLVKKYGEKGEELLARAVLGSRGFLGRAEEIYSGKKNIADERYNAFMNALAHENLAEMVLALSFDNKKRNEFNDLIDNLLNGFKTILVCAGYKKEISGLSNEERLIVSFGEKRIKNIYDAFMKTKIGIKFNVNMSLWSVYIVKECLKKI
ncbi:MAG: hypothetical protein DBX47_03650 [Clostridiales bacterium]|nr:MAG: hypothetical protein DBX47_03650 [Clostridiales bacterium]